MQVGPYEKIVGRDCLLQLPRFPDADEDPTQRAQPSHRAPRLDDECRERCSVSRAKRKKERARAKWHYDNISAAGRDMELNVERWLVV
jgi:hypothetical protein